MTKAFSVRDSLTFTCRRTKDEFPIRNIEEIMRKIFVPRYFERYKKGIENFNNPNIYKNFVYELGALKENGNWVRSDDVKLSTHIGFFFGNDSPWYMLSRFENTTTPFDGLLIKPEKIYRQDWKSHRQLHKRPFLIFKLSDFDVVWETEESYVKQETKVEPARIVLEDGRIVTWSEYEKIMGYKKD